MKTRYDRPSSLAEDTENICYAGIERDAQHYLRWLEDMDWPREVWLITRRWMSQKIEHERAFLRVWGLTPRRDWNRLQ